MIGNYSVELQKKYMPFAIVDENNNIIGFVGDTPISAKKAAKEHILMSKKFDDCSNYEYWDNLIIKLGLENIE